MNSDGIIPYSAKLWQGKNFGELNVICLLDLHSTGQHGTAKVLSTYDQEAYFHVPKIAYIFVFMMCKPGSRVFKLSKLLKNWCRLGETPIGH